MRLLSVNGKKLLKFLPALDKYPDIPVTGVTKYNYWEMLTT